MRGWEGGGVNARVFPKKTASHMGLPSLRIFSCSACCGDAPITGGKVATGAFNDEDWCYRHEQSLESAECGRRLGASSNTGFVATADALAVLPSGSAVEGHFERVCSESHCPRVSEFGSHHGQTLEGGGGGQTDNNQQQTCARSLILRHSPPKLIAQACNTKANTRNWI
jgi:hypothetical protein